MQCPLPLAWRRIVAAPLLIVALPGHAVDPSQRVVRVGFVGTESPSTAGRWASAMWQRLRELGWVESQNLVIEARWAEGRIDRLPALMNEMVDRKVDVLVTYSTPGGLAGKWLELLQETVPRLSTVAAIGSPDSPLYRDLTKELEVVAPTRRLKRRFIDARTPDALDGAFAQARLHAQAVLVLPDPVAVSGQ